MTADGFPIDWDEWRTDWDAWLRRHPKLVRIEQKIPGKNFLADEILGTFRLPDRREVELSEMTFPNLEERDAATGRLLEGNVRGIGLTWVRTRDGKVVGSFAELEQELGLRS